MLVAIDVRWRETAAHFGQWLYTLFTSSIGSFLCCMHVPDIMHVRAVCMLWGCHVIDGGCHVGLCNMYHTRRVDVLCRVC